jgi:hypothetical protein
MEKHPHSGFILDFFDKQKIPYFEAEEGKNIKDEIAKEIPTSTKGKDSNSCLEILFQAHDDSMGHQWPKIKLEQLLVGKTCKKFFISKNESISPSRSKVFPNDLSKIEGFNLNENNNSMMRNLTALNKQRMNLSTEENSYQTHYIAKKTNMTTRTDEDKSGQNITEQSLLQKDAQAFSRFFAQDDYDPLFQVTTMEENDLFEIMKNRSRAYVTTAPLRNKITVDRKQRIEEIRDFKQMNKSMLTLFRYFRHLKYSQANKTQLSVKIKKAKEIKNIMKREQSQERERNLRMLSILNKKEKLRNREIRTQHQQERKNMNLVMKVMVNKSMKNNKIIQENLRFVNNFNQAKNIIEKQIFKGRLIKERKNITIENRKKKEMTKYSRSFISHQAIPNKIFDSAVSHPMMLNSFMDMDGNDTYSSTMCNDQDTFGTKNSVYNSRESLPLRNKSQRTKRIRAMDQKHFMIRNSTAQVRSRIQKEAIKRRQIMLSNP